jgi:hypothetical protein
MLASPYPPKPDAQGGIEPKKLAHTERFDAKSRPFERQKTVAGSLIKGLPGSAVIVISKCTTLLEIGGIWSGIC